MDGFGGSLGASGLWWGVLCSSWSLFGGSWIGLGGSLGASFGALGALWELPKDKRLARRHHHARKVLTGQVFLANSQAVLHFSYIFKNAERLRGASWRAARRNVGATGEELKEGKGVQKFANLKRSCLDPALSPCLTRRRGGGGSLRAFRRAREGAAEGRSSLGRRRWPGGKMEGSRWEVVVGRGAGGRGEVRR